MIKSCKVFDLINEVYRPYKHVDSSWLERPRYSFPAGHNRKFLSGRERKSRIRDSLIRRLRGREFAKFATHVKAISVRLRPRTQGNTNTPTPRLAKTGARQSGLVNLDDTNQRPHSNRSIRKKKKVSGRAISIKAPRRDCCFWAKVVKKSLVVKGFAKRS